jgi:cyclin-dependent kinase 12/13
MLTLCPERRITASDALDHSWMKNVEPAQIPPPQLPKHQDCHELWLKTIKRQQFQREA